ncbi:MAG: TIM barrel protein [Desulfobacterales bacterium]|jgi:sugar phosphate isomerase/epimerase
MQKLALSTSFTSNRPHTGKTLLDLLEKLKVAELELDYRISETLYKQFREALKQSHLKVVSIHNFFPIPSIRPDSGGGGDLLLLSHPDKEQRSQAIGWTTKTIENARALGARAVVLHCGYVDMNPELDKLYHYFYTDQINSPEARAFIHKKRGERERLKSRYFESLLYSLDCLAHIAEETGIWLGVENRYHYHELPDITELEILLEKFNGAPIGYWHDTGHAHANESLTLMPAGSLLDKFSNHLVGIHLHDATGLSDHLVPGTGEIAFDCLKSHIHHNTLLVMELNPGTPDEQVLQGIQFLHRLGFN